MLEELYEAYRIHAGTILSDDTASAFNPPILIQPPASWAKADHRIAFVGQETREWAWTKEDAARWNYEWPHPDIATLADFKDSKSSVASLMEGYKKFNFGQIIPRLASSPFWRYFAELTRYFETNSLSGSALFTNLIRCASNADQGFTLWTVGTEEREQYLSWQNGLLRKELTEIKPTLIVFVTGPGYDDFLAAEFPGIGFQPVERFDVRQLAVLSGGGLPAPAYRTYHPGYLNRQLGFEPINLAIGHALSKMG